MVTYSFEIWNESEKESSHKREFEDDVAANEWWRSQQGHPWLSIQNFKKVE